MPEKFVLSSFKTLEDEYRKHEAEGRLIIEKEQTERQEEEEGAVREFRIGHRVLDTLN